MARHVFVESQCTMHGRTLCDRVIPPLRTTQNQKCVGAVNKPDNNLCKQPVSGNKPRSGGSRPGNHNPNQSNQKGPHHARF